MAAAGSAVGLGNIWGFPTQAASNGGAAFVLVYLILAFCLAYPVLMAELIIGRHGQANNVESLRKISNGKLSAGAGTFTAYYGLITASLILSFYAIVGGWMASYLLASITQLIGADAATKWMTSFGETRNILFTAVFMVFTATIVSRGVADGIEKWSNRLMPMLLGLLVLMIVYVLTLPGAGDGLRAYLVPDFSRALEPDLIVSAMGQAFFSLSLGVGTMMIYGSYISERENLPVTGGIVTCVDISIAVLAGFLIMPAMYAAQHNGVQIFNEAGALIDGDTLIFNVLPPLFESIGPAGPFVALVFFLLMTIAALTSSISMLEVPVAFAAEHHKIARGRAAALIAGTIGLVSAVIVFNFGSLFGKVVAFTTEFSQPLLGLFLCLFASWVWHRDGVLQAMKKGAPDLEQGLFWKIWPAYVKFLCPLFILLIFLA
jgi:NSS family neurotransmitter:Na+ symporter